MISFSGVGMHFGGQDLFHDVSWQLKAGAHYGLVGANGAGKSTLLRLMDGSMEPEAGQISRPNGLRIGQLGQDHFEFDDQALLQVVLRGNPRLWRALREKQALLEESGGETLELDMAKGARLGDLEVAIADAGGYDAEARAGALLSGLGLSEERHREPMAHLSGGYRLRVLLAQTLFADPDLLLLDEPTNHLDLLSIRWLENHLRNFRGTFVLVSHDRHFLNAVCDFMADVDYQEVTLYPGNYDVFEAAKELASVQREAEAQRTEQKIAEMQGFITRFRAKATKARQAQSRKKQVERMEIPEIKRTSRRFPQFAFAQRRPSGKEVLTVSGINKTFDGKPVLKGVGFALARGERLAIVGANGVGKTTLLKIIHGTLPADSGKAEPGYEVSLGYFAQDHREALKGEGNVYQWLRGQSEGESVSELRGLLGRALFSGEEADKSLKSLSGGESARLLLAGLMRAKPNLLVLDEPTNHLDLEGREALLKALNAYQGTVIIVSHDRHFVSALADRLLILTQGGMEIFEGEYEAYLASQGEDYLAREQSAATGEGRSKTVKPEYGAGEYQQRKAHKKGLNKLRKEVRLSEQEISQLEETLAEIDRRHGQPDFHASVSWEKVQAEQKQRGEMQTRLKSVMAKWERAAHNLERLEAEAGPEAASG